MKYQFNFKSYKRVFKKPLNTNFGVLLERKGIIVRLESETGAVGFGEIAPMEHFGTESFEEALAWCSGIGSNIYLEAINKINIKLPCCRWGVESAIRKESEKKGELKGSALCALGELPEQGFSCVKYKIGVGKIDDEIEIFCEIMGKISKETQVRLDANGGLNGNEMEKWLGVLEDFQNIEYLEQPMAKGLESEMRDLGRKFKTALALDESVVGVRELERFRDWEGVFVVKPSFLGDFEGFLKWRETVNPENIVYSGAFETDVGLRSFFEVAGGSNRAVGLGTLDYFNDNLNAVKNKSTLNSNKINLTKIWIKSI